MFHIHSLVPELWCSDFDESLRFYTEVLGFTVTQRRGEDYHAYLELGDAQLMIAHWEQDGTWEPAPLEKPYGRGVNFYLCRRCPCGVPARVICRNQPVRCYAHHIVLED